jgi:protein-disulfide isomerase
MFRVSGAVLTAALAAGVVLSQSASAQTSVPPNQATPFKDPGILKPPAGAKVAILEWEDLECPACAHAFPIVHEAVRHYNIPIVERDFLINGHLWSKEAAVYARFLKDKVSPDLATEYRREVFASQYRISSKEDLQRFTQQFFSSHGKQLPFVADPNGELMKEIQADVDLGMKLGVNETPTIIVVTQHHWIQVKDPMQLYNAIDQANAMAAHEGASPAPSAKHIVAHGKK